MFKRIIRDPLFHFLLLGAAIFAIYGFAKRHSTDKPGQIVVIQSTIENLVTGFTRTWQRPPTEEELRGLIRDYIREEAAYREALAMGLDRDDMIVRRRLRQKLEFISDDLTSRTEPTNDQLQSFLWLFSFQQIYLNPQLHGGDISRDASRLLEVLQRPNQQRDPAALGDPFLLPENFQGLSLSDVKKTFGEQFASALSALPIGQWRGPVNSSYGGHFIYLSQRAAAYLPVLADIRDQVRREWLNAQRIEGTDRFYEALLRHYTVKIEPAEEKKVAQVH